MNDPVMIQLLTGPVGALALCLIAIFIDPYSYTDSHN